MLKRFAQAALVLTLALAAVGAVGIPAPAMAQSATPSDLSAADRASLVARVDEMNFLVASGQYGSLMDFLPPRVVTLIAETFGVDEAEARRATVESVQQLMSEVTIVDYRIDAAGAKAYTTPDGSRQYAILNLSMLMEIEGMRIKATSSNIAFMDKGVWYIMDATDPALAEFLYAAYPEFQGVPFQEPTMEILD